ncbi:putative lysophospholipase BODYGUARD 4 [Apium graveolens]|uniref:putative lysophospholipase BODYGUARD 4 n=1 Tax=Apium graveolens TaxID=4045 RepID=UPI003D79C41A
MPKWLTTASQFLISSLSFITFFFLDFLDFLFCIYFYYIDGFLEGKSTPCYCKTGNEDKKSEHEVSETLYLRKNVFRKIRFVRKYENLQENEIGLVGNRWSDCGCESCVAWMMNADHRLFVAVNHASQASLELVHAKPAEDVLFLHGFLSSSEFWTRSIFPEFSEDNYRLFAMDLLGFGRSPKPRACLYTLRDHLEMIEESVMCPFQLKSFHLVAHSMGCVIALALAAKYPDTVKSVTLVAPPYFPSSSIDAGTVALERLAGKSLWPPILFGSAVMTWYEHLGRCVCFFICRNHRTWEKILKLFTRKRDLLQMLENVTQHTHHSAWHTMHNVICGGAKNMDEYLETIRKSGVKITVIQGSRDQVVPLECSNNIKTKVPDADVRVIANADHGSVILGRSQDFARDLESIWASTADTRVQG